jgi:hypothetical protein
MEAVTVEGTRGRAVMVECVNGVIVVTPLSNNGPGVPIYIHDEMGDRLADAVCAARDEAKAVSRETVRMIILGEGRKK